MKNLLLLILAALLCSCSKTETEISPATPAPVPYFLDFSGSTVNIAGLRQVSCKDLYSGSTDIGDMPRFEQDGFILQVPIEGGKPTGFGMGVISGNSFILSCDSSTISVCSGGQNLPVHFRIYQ